MVIIVRVGILHATWFDTNLIWQSTNSACCRKDADHLMPETIHLASHIGLA